MKVLIEKLDHQGRGIAKIDNKPIFIPNSLPDEEVKIEIIKEKKKYSEGIVKEYIIKSKKRIDPKCPYFELCGGCDLMNMEYDDQAKYKENKIKEIITKFTNISLEKIKPIIKCEQDFYRNKITLHNKNNLGYYSKRTNEIINIKKCLIVDNHINDVISKLNELKLDNIYEVIIRSSKNIKNTMIVLKINDDIDINYYVENLKEYVDTIIIYKNNKYIPIYNEGYIYETLGSYKFKISPDSFFQVNTFQTEKLYDEVKKSLEAIGNEKVLDLYCGTGTIGIYISECVKSVYGIEINKSAVEDAIENKKINNISNIDFECLDASLVKKIKNDFDIIIVDPPRSGLDKNTIEYLLESKTEKIIYVSCDPVTLARDLNLLENKFETEKITPVDMFPNTYHVECVCLLKRK